MKSESLFIGIDGGSTACRTRIRDIDGKLLGEGRGGPANILQDPILAKESISAAVRAAAVAAGLGDRNIDRLHAGFGLAGAGLKAARDRLRDTGTLFRSCVIETDAYIACLGAHGGADGGIVNIGTGSCGFALVGGRRISVGGWGPLLSDEASGYWIGLEALRRTLWAYDGRAEKTLLSSVIFDKFEAKPAQMLAFATTARPSDFAALAPVVFAYAETQDPLALALIGDAGTAATKLVHRLFEAGAPAVSLVGGLADELSAWLHPSLRARLTEPQNDPQEGAILMVRRALLETQ